MAKAPRLDLASVLRLDTDGERSRARRIATAIVADWKAEARAELGSTSQEYRNAIRIGKADEHGVSVELVGKVPNLVEQGMGPGGIGTSGPYDVRKFVLKPGTSNLRHGAKGMYVNVPFRHTAGSIRAMGGESALDQAYNLRGVRSVGGRIKWPKSGPRALPPGLAPKMKPHHAADPLAGLVRFHKQYARTKGRKQPSTFKTWRRMSEGGKPWISRGVRPRNLADRVLRRLPRLLQHLEEW
jgi:hypothetical protein